ncbi:MAG TPA: four helix bundle protein [Herpetosiphonaceae bacterium]
MDDRFSYRNLILWQRAQELAHDVIQVTKRLPNSWSSAVIARQIIASVTSIGANIAEGHGRFTFAAYRNHLSIARGSTAETDSWLDLLYREGLLEKDEEQRLHQRCRQLLGMLTTKINVLDAENSRNKNSLRETSAEYTVDPPVDPTLLFDENDYSP